MQKNLIVLNTNDNVAVTPFIIPAKIKIEGQNNSSIDDIPFGQKIFLMIRRPPRSTRKESSAASDVYKRQ